MILYPDMTRRAAPKDGEYFYHGANYYKWDDELGRWRDPWDGFWSPIPALEAGSVPTWQSDGGGEAIISIPPKPVAAPLKDFFFGSNKSGCECGSWTMGNVGHSDFCKLYTKNT